MYTVRLLMPCFTLPAAADGSVGALVCLKVLRTSLSFAYIWSSANHREDPRTLFRQGYHASDHPLRDRRCNHTDTINTVRIAKTVLILFITICSYFKTPYCSSDTASSHSLLPFSPGISTARWENQESGAAPCQCFTPTGMLTTLPGVISMASLLHS